MKRFSLIVTLLLAVLLLQNCTKDTFTATANSNDKLYAVVNDTTWTPDTLSAAVTYNSAAKTKVFSFTGMYLNKQVNVAVTQTTATNTPGFPLASFHVDNTANTVMTYFNEQKNSSGTYVLTQQGTVAPGSGFLTVTAIDSVKKVITGTFSFTAEKNNYDTNGKVTSVYVAQISDGAFNNLPYTFVSH